MSESTLTICFDGTFNETDLPDAQSNVLLISRLLANQADGYYLEGVGTRQGELIGGGVRGCGVRDRVRDAYVWLQARFARLEGTDAARPKVFIFGFSRGAYSARLLAGLIACSGIPRLGVCEEVGLDAFFDHKSAKANKFKAKGSYFDIEVEMLGVWDTVNSTGEDDLGEKAVPDNVRHAYHAMSIDEKRKDFELVRWNEGTRGEEVWFPGVHSDVGGGYKERTLSDVALGWVISKANDCGLAFLPEATKYTETIPVGVVPTVHESLIGAWVVLGAKQRVARAGDRFHRSLETTIAQAVNYSPVFSPSGAGGDELYYV